MLKLALKSLVHFLLNNIVNRPILTSLLVIEAKDLPAMDRGGTSDPFVRILYGPEITVKTGHVNKNLNPKWHKHFALKGKFPKIIFEVFDHDAIGRVSFLFFKFSISLLIPLLGLDDWICCV